MKKALVIGVGLWLAIASVVAIVWSPTPTLRQVSGVYQVWFWSFVASWVLVAVMCTPCGLKVREIRHMDARVRQAIALGARHQSFWIGFWGSLFFTIVNNIAPLFLFLYLPFWTAAIANAVNLFFSSGAIIIRPKIYRAAKSQVSVA